MAPNSLRALLRKRADARRAIATAERRIADRRAQIAAIEAEMALYTNDVEHKPKALRLPWRANGEMQRAMFELLRERGTATSADLAAVMARRFDMPEDERAMFYLRQRCTQAFKRCERAGLVTGTPRGGRGAFRVWSAAPQ